MYVLHLTSDELKTLLSAAQQVASERGSNEGAMRSVASKLERALKRKPKSK